MGIRNTVVARWFHEQVDPKSETVVSIVTTLNQLNPAAAKLFIRFYLGDMVENSDLRSQADNPEEPEQNKDD